ncbi:phage tail assembly protein [Commensalibacter papalotli (ex Botero et al. 2024)]|uniref:phage tail assembly protein n=1 Tax=Commensalibacter papalotli (ex Botero et al. 2024) TaxID=2972766 RepID=UPI0022FF508D|nr:phage tail assembly protein [Commensalibacter papalotli (ex Botero et al. 2024)]CAI3945548.1 unnamed protein product [Commensalibacter papalotli (ex Botero et al. 2024)]
MEPTKKITLNSLILVDGHEYKEINLSEPIANDVITAFKSMGNKNSGEAYYDVQIALIAKVSGIPVKALEELPTRILDEAIEYIMAFQKNNEVDCSEDRWEMELDKPISLSGADGDMIETLTLQEPTVKQRKMAMHQMDQYSNQVIGGFEFQVSLLTSVTGQKMATILKLPISKFFKASNYLMHFFPSGQETGENLVGN